MSTTKLFCFPYAGGSGVMYNRWRPLLDPSIELQMIEIPGRGRRFADPLVHTLDEMADDLLRQMRGALDGSPFLLFGHSMGALLVYELARRIRAELGLEPAHAFFSGRYPPHYLEIHRYHELPDDEFQQCVARLGGLPDELLANPPVLKLFLNVLRADFAAVETYQHHDTTPLRCDISVLYGEDDVDMAICDPREWARYTTGTCRWHGYPGGHFFIHEHAERIVRLINHQLNAKEVQS